MGCGFNYYYLSEADARNGQNQIQSIESIGGYCINDTNRIQCECTHETLDGIYIGCQSICPGLLGPILDSESGNLTFIECGGHGECDKVDGSCNCEQGYGGDGCNAPYKAFKMQDDVFWTFTGIIVVFAVMIIWGWIWLFGKAHYENMLLINENMTSLYCSAHLLQCFRAILGLIHPADPIWICNAQQYIFGFGVLFTTLPIILRADTILKVFRMVQNQENVKQVSLEELRNALTKKAKLRYRKASYLFFYGAIVIQLSLCIAHTFASFDFGSENIIYDDVNEQIGYVCHAGRMKYVQYANILWAMLLFAMRI